MSIPCYQLSGRQILPTAKEVWEVVKQIYSDGEDSSKSFEIKAKFWQIKQVEMEVTNYHMEMLSLWYELDLCSDE